MSLPSRRGRGAAISIHDAARLGPERVRDADGHDPAGAGLELHPTSVEVEDGLALEHVEAGLERVDVCVDVPAVEGDERQRHVRRPE